MPLTGKALSRSTKVGRVQLQHAGLGILDPSNTKVEVWAMPFERLSGSSPTSNPTLRRKA